MSLNKVMLIGFVGTDPEVRVLSSGNKVANLTLATTERGYTTQSGQTVPDRTEWHSLTVWGKGADVIEKYVRKGSQIYVEGKIKTRSWTDDGGVTRYKTEIQVDIFELLDRKNTNNGSDQRTRDPLGYPVGNDDLPY